MRYLLFVLVAIFLCPSCRVAQPDASSLIASATTQAASTTREENQSEKVNRLEGELRAARADLSYEQNRWPRLIANLIAGACTLGTAISFIACIFLPVMKKRLMILGTAFAVGLVVALTVRAALPYLPWVGLGLIVAAVGATLPTFILHARERLNAPF